MSETVIVYEFDWVGGVKNPRLVIERKEAVRTERQVRVPTWGGRYAIHDPAACLYTLEALYERIQASIDRQRAEGERLLAAAANLQRQLDDVTKGTVETGADGVHCPS